MIGAISTCSLPCNCPGCRAASDERRAQWDREGASQRDVSRAAYDRAMANFAQSPAAWNIAKAVRDQLNADPARRPIGATELLETIKSVLAAEMVAGRIEFTDSQGLGL